MIAVTTVLRKSGIYWVALCPENGLVGQGTDRDEAIQQLKEAIDAVRDVDATESDVKKGPISAEELHEFLTIEEKRIACS